MNLLSFLVNITFFTWIIKNIFFWVTLWQVKEYRLDRLFIHLKDTKQGRDILFSPLLLLKLMGIFGYIYALFYHKYLFPYQLFVSLLFIFQGFIFFQEFLSHLVKRPVWTYKALLLVFLTLSVSFLLVFFPLIFEVLLWLLIVDRLVPFVS